MDKDNLPSDPPLDAILKLRNSINQTLILTNKINTINTINNKHFLVYRKPPDIPLHYRLAPILCCKCHRKPPRRTYNQKSQETI
tara:strand:+ start:133 stop:384 length:252 start_codon:yes stop_codon:yes gene_type:complete